MIKSFTTAALALALTGSIAMAVPAEAVPLRSGFTLDQSAQQQTWNHGRRFRDRYDGYYGNGYYNNYEDGDDYREQRRYDEPVYRNTQVWRGDDGRYYCRHRDGTTGLLIGGAVGALLGREVAGYRGDRTLGAILGAAGGALIGREIDRNGSRCR